MTTSHETESSGVAAAAFVAAGIGCMAVGLFTTLAAISEGVNDLLNWWGPAGPLTGKTGLALILWLVAWLVLHQLWKTKAVNFGRAFFATLVLIALGLIGTFPTFFELFH